MAILSGSKRGIFGHFLGEKLKTTSSAFLKEFFPSCTRTISFRIPRKISVLMENRFTSCGHFKQPKKGYF
jgi:hypothetical protein